MKARLRWVPLLVAAMVAAAACGADDDEPAGGGAAADDYPNKNVTWIVPFAAGGGADAAFRLFQKYAEPTLQVKMPITNVEGAGGVTGWTQFLNSQPDGYTMSLATPPFNIIPKVIQPNETPYELDQFKYVCSYANSPNAAFVKTGDSRFKTLQDVIAFAKANPRKLSAGVTGAAGTDAIHMYQLQEAAGVEFALVPFDSGADAAQALSAGQIDLVFSDTSWVQLGAGKMTAVAVSSEEEHPDFPDVTTYKEAGYDVVGARLRAPAAPPGTPDNVLRYWENVCKTVSENEQFKQEMAKIGQPVEFLTGQQATELVQQITADIQKIAQDQGLIKQ
jgi:putative tricarboxylic transport membrane protein